MSERWTATLSKVAQEPMTNGLLERAKEGPRFAPPAASPARRAATAAIALLIGVAAVLVVLKTTGAIRSQPAQDFRDPVFGWTAIVPNGWHWAAIAPINGVTFASFELGDSPPTIYVPTEADLIPSDGAIVQIVGGAISLDQYNQDDIAPFPLRLSQGGPGDLHRTFDANGMQFEILVWLGDDVSNSTRAEVDDLVASIRFPSLPDPPPGEGTVFEPGLISLGPQERFPIRSVTPLRVEGTSDVRGWLVLVHAPRGFYVLSGTWEEPCSIEWHPEEKLIEGCRAHPGPWNKFGRRAEGFHGRGAFAPIEVVVNFDGRLISSPYRAAPIDTREYWHDR